MKIGFIGLGNMGAPMAANLAKAGHAVTGFDVSGVAVEGVSQAASGAEAASGADVVITMLPNGAILRAVANEILPAMGEGAVFLDCSTVDVESARAVADQASAVAGVSKVLLADNAAYEHQQYGQAEDPAPIHVVIDD